MKRPFATLILAGGKGTRMGSSDQHKVCFPVQGVPVILRALETYNLCGARFNIVVVGMLAAKVMATINARLPGTIFAFQEQPRGTGDAARKGAEILERLQFDGDVLVVAGDKVIEPRAIRALLAQHRKTGADVTLATVRRPPGASAGILLKSPRGHIVGILEENERQRLLALALLGHAFQRRVRLATADLRSLLARECADKVVAKLLDEFDLDKPSAASFTRAEFERRTTADERAGRLHLGRATVPVERILDRFRQINLSTYVFRAPVLIDALHRLKARARGAEEYLTDVFELLTARKPSARVVGCPLENPQDIMAFNNPQELLAIEEVYRRQHPAMVATAPVAANPRLAPVSTWDTMLTSPSAAVCRRFKQWYGEEIPWGSLRAVLGAFADRYGAARPVAVIRSPGRINLLGRHIDHQGGSVNVMAVNREIFLVAAPREDDRVVLANTRPEQFAPQEFRISDLVANLDWDDWQRVVDGPRLQRLLEEARGDWANYVKAAILRLQEQFRDRRLRGMDLTVSGGIPMGAGLSSSSALVVAAAEASIAFNQLPVSANRLVSLCGEGEWFVGTRGGAADHAAIKLSRRGYVTRVGFFPFRLEATAPFFPRHDLLVCHSGIFAGKSSQARQLFNEKVTAYHVGRVWFKMLHPELASRIEHLRDLNPRRLGVSRAAFIRMLAHLPPRMSRAKVQAAFAQLAPPDREQLEQLFHSHDAPASGYPVRDVVVFGLAEMERARRCLDLLQAGNAVELGRLMRVSHDGDRVSRRGRNGCWRRTTSGVSDRALPSLARQRGAAGDLGNVAGAYRCSLPEIDRLVDLALELPGVEGAQLAGAGLGGCAMVLVQKAHTDDVLRALAHQGVQAEVFRPIAGAGALIVE